MICFLTVTFFFAKTHNSVFHLLNIRLVYVYPVIGFRPSDRGNIKMAPLCISFSLFFLLDSALSFDKTFLRFLADFCVLLPQRLNLAPIALLPIEQYIILKA